MSVFPRSLLIAIASSAVFSAPLLASADPVGLHVEIGDLSTPAGVKAFNQRLDIAATRACQESFALNDMQAMTSCKMDVRQEVLHQLTPAQQQAYNAGGQTGAMASSHDDQSGVRSRR